MQQIYLFTCQVLVKEAAMLCNPNRYFFFLQVKEKINLNIEYSLIWPHGREGEHLMKHEELK